MTKKHFEFNCTIKTSHTQYPKSNLFPTFFFYLGQILYPSDRQLICPHCQWLLMLKADKFTRVKELELRFPGQNKINNNYNNIFLIKVNIGIINFWQGHEPKCLCEKFFFFAFWTASSSQTEDNLEVKSTLVVMEMTELKPHFAVEVSSLGVPILFDMQKPVLYLDKLQYHTGNRYSLLTICSRPQSYACLLTFSIWSASRRSLASLRLGLNVSTSSSVLTDASCLEFTSSLVVIYEHKKSVIQPLQHWRERGRVLDLVGFGEWRPSSVYSSASTRIVGLGQWVWATKLALVTLELRNEEPYQMHR